MKNYTQPWLANPVKEITLILAPAFIPVLLVIIFQDYFMRQSEVTSVWWILLVLCIDVSHVYSTVFRMYWDRATFTKYKALLLIIPATAFVIALSLHLYSPHLFWRILAYVAVYHFIRQQYGFMRLYSRKENGDKVGRWIDAAAIYSATLYPLAYWHLYLTRQLSWFVEGDFIPVNFPQLKGILFWSFIVILVLYTSKEVWISIRRKYVNIPKNMIVYGTYVSWYAGIVLFKGDLIFTLLNVVAHGIPYMGLIWIYGEKKASATFSFSWKGVGIFAAVLLFLAYIEETFWDVLIWKDHPDIFPFLTTLDSLNDPVLLSIVVSILVLPQITHYVLDGFIWRFSKDAQARI